ncbi:MAG TPA: hypothetical protein PK011_07125 [Marinagarivorans sp.]|nr:hypothetical protein [Marinagarivorans sp.]HNG60676.1 hypothetical protein [Cellvibrionaceae bacterium]
MQLINASLCSIANSDGITYEYVRLIYKSGQLILGYSILPHRVSKELLALVKNMDKK